MASGAPVWFILDGYYLRRLVTSAKAELKVREFLGQVRPACSH